MRDTNSGMTGRRFLKSGVGLAFSQAIVQLCAFLRNVFIARLITPADFGIAATFAMTFSLLEIISSLAPDKLLIQAEDGNEPRFLHTTHFLQAWRGLMNGVIILVLAGPVSYLFSVPGARWAFRWLALVPLFKGFAHQDPNRLQREMKFRASIMVELVSSVLVTLVAVPLGLWLKDYSVMLWLLIVQALVSLLVSHLVAERSYRWAWDPRYMQRILNFGWPLLINGVLLYVIFQGDRFLIGAAPRLFVGTTYKLTDLGIYSVAFSLTMAPTSLVANVSTSLFLPLLSRVQDSLQEFERRYLACSLATSILAAFFSIPVIVGGHWLILFVYGWKYAAAGSFIAWLAGMWAVRIIRVAPTLAAVAKCDTRNAMISNVARTAALAGVVLAIATGRPLIWVAACGFFGELLAMAVNVFRLTHRHGVAAMLCLKPAMITLAGMGIAALTTRAGTPGWFQGLLISAVLAAAVAASMFYLFPDFRRHVRALIPRRESPVTLPTIPCG
jgi:O-antigen/teichoic acid export membrane protein